MSKDYSLFEQGASLTPRQQSLFPAESRRSRKGSGSGSTSHHSTTSLSSSVKARMNLRMAEMNLHAMKREQALRKAMLETELAVIHAETELSKAKIRSEASQGLLDLDDDEPSLSAHEKVSDYVNSLPQPDVNTTPSEQDPALEPPMGGLLLSGNKSAVPDSQSPDLSSGAGTAIAPALGITTFQQGLNPLASSWQDSNTVPSCNQTNRVLRQSAPAVSSTFMPGHLTPAPNRFPPVGQVSFPVSHGPAAPVNSIILPQISEFPAQASVATSSLADMFSGLALNETTSSHAIAHGPAIPASHIPRNCASGSLPFPYSFPSSTTNKPPGVSFANTTHYDSGMAHGPAAPVETVPSPQVNGLLTSALNLPVAHGQSNQVVSCSVPSGSHFPNLGVAGMESRQFTQTAVARASIDDFARVLVRCQSSRALCDNERYDGDPLRYHQFIRQVEDRILNIYRQTDPGHALQLLLQSTTGRARKLIENCIMLPPSEALKEALNLLYRSFGSPDVAIKAHLKRVCEGPPVGTDERHLQDFYTELVNCKMVLESANATHLLNAVSTAEGIFARFPKPYQEKFADLALRRGFSMDVVPFDLFIEFIDRAQRLASSRLGRLMKSAKGTAAPRQTPGRWNKFKSTQVHVAQVDTEKNTVTSNVTKPIKTESRKSKNCAVCDSTTHRTWACEKFNEKSVKDRRMLVNEKRLCYNCLGTGHSVKDCPSNMRCRTCEKAHHTLIHQSKSSDSPPKEQRPEPVKEDDKSVKSSNLVSAVSVDTVGSCHQAGIRSKLQVLAVSLKNPLTGLKKNIWALLDSGADAHLLTEKLYLELGLEGRPILSKLQLADGGLKTLKTFETDCVVQDVDGNQSFHLNDVCVTEHLPDISGSIPSAADVTHYDYLTGIEIPSIDEKEIELIIGMKAPELHIFSEVRHGGSFGPWAGKTPLGWVLFGPEHSASDPAHKVSNSHVCLLTTQKLETFSDVICPCQFEHADLYSRGVSPRQTHKAINWLKAPEFLFMDESLWPSRDRNLNCIENGNHKLPLCSGDPAHSSDYVEPEDPSNLTIAASVKNTQPDTDPDILVCLTARFSTLPRAVKAVAWILRLKNVLHNRAKGIAGASNLSPIGGEEFKSALLVLIRLSQQQAFPGLVEALEISPWHDVMASKRGVTAKTSLQPLQRFCPFVENGVIRIGGRLQRSSLPKDFKHPIVLSKDHHVTGLIVLDVHSNYGHNASQYVLNKLRERYHVVGQNRTVKRFIKENCMVCRNQNARTGSQLMSPLPAARVDHGSSAFECCGVDYMGPLEVKQGRSTLKRYCCVFTCLASRATHLEMAYDLTTESFLMCLRRFLSTRGHATRVMYSDYGTNFVGAKSELQRGIQRLCNDRIMKELAPKCIEWIQAPPLASHQGGVYEAIIRLVRKVMASLMSDRRLRTLTDEGLVTLLKEIEYVLNCRPLTRVGTDPNDFQALSPIMILTGCIGPGLPPDVFLSSDGMRSSWRACQLQADEFWRRWKIEYLPMLQRRGKWLTPCQNLNKGDLVLLVDDDQPRNIWRKGVIEETLPDRDGIVRRVKVRTAEQKTYMRDVRKLCLLECDI